MSRKNTKGRCGGSRKSNKDQGPKVDFETLQNKRWAQWLSHALCLTELAASNLRALEMLRVHLEAMREELA